MRRNLTQGKRIKQISMLVALVIASFFSHASSHREAPLIANDPLADNTDLYAFRSPDDTNTITIIANYIPAEFAFGGPNYNTFGENVRYEIHINNGLSTTGDKFVYRFTFTKINQDPTTFFNIRLGKQNQMATYVCEKSSDGGTTFTTIVSAGVVPPPNIGPRSISSGVGLNTADYNTLITADIATATGGGGEKVFAGPADDPFFVDLGGIFDLGDAPRQGGAIIRDALAKHNVHSICIKIPISSLQMSGKTTAQASSILDPAFVIGVWASASRQATRTLNTLGSGSVESGNWVQVSRLGMPLTNEAVIPIGKKDIWNSMTPYQDLDSLAVFGPYFYNPELALYMDTEQYGGAVPAFAALRIQHKALGAYDFGNGKSGLYGLKGNPALTGTAFDPTLGYQALLLPNATSPRSVDIWPIFNTGVPNLPPYQLATGKAGNPLAAGKPFINNFLPTGGDMLRLNMAVPVTPRNDPNFSSEGLLAAAVLGLTNATYNTTANLQFIPNMDGFPNGRRLEDDVTRIELQAVGGVVLAAVGLWYDDYVPNETPSAVTNQLVNVLNYSTGVEKNDTTFKASFPYVQTPWSGAKVVYQ